MDHDEVHFFLLNVRKEWNKKNKKLKLILISNLFRTFPWPLLDGSYISAYFKVIQGDFIKGRDTYCSQGFLQNREWLSLHNTGDY